MVPPPISNLTGHPSVNRPHLLLGDHPLNSLQGSATDESPLLETDGTDKQITCTRGEEERQLRVGGLETEIHEASRKVISNTDDFEAVVHGRTELKTDSPPGTHRQAFLSCRSGESAGCSAHLHITLKSVQSCACLFPSPAYSSRNLWASIGSSEPVDLTQIPALPLTHHVTLDKPLSFPGAE